MTFDLEHIRSRNPIEEVVAEKFALKKSGSHFIGVEHDSLVVVPNTGFYFWNSRGEHGDVFDFVDGICCQSARGTIMMRRSLWKSCAIWRSAQASH